MSGKLAPGMRLPSVRDFATQIKVNPNTIQKALAELEDLELVYTERTNGKFVTTNEDLIATMKTRFANEIVTSYLKKMRNLGFTTPAAIKYLKSNGGKSGTTPIH